MKVLIVGGVAGGASAAARLRRLDEHAEIIMFEKGEHISYATCGLPYYIGDVIKDRDNLFVQTPEAMKARFNIDVRTESEVISVNPQEKNITVKSKARGIYSESYDYLILAPGAKPFRPNIPGINNDKIYTVRNLHDADAVKSLACSEAVRSVVIIGGGFIGIEMAENLRKRGIEVSVVEMFPHILSQFDEDIAVLIERELEKNGVNLVLNTMVNSVEENGEKIEITLSNGEKLTADFVILATGIVPDTDFLRGSGIELGPRGHIIVNERMQTNIKEIYAVGDAVEVADFVNGRKTAKPLAGPANKQGRIAADNIAGINSVYRGTQGTSITKVFNLTAACTGNNEKDLKLADIPYEVIYVHPMSHASYYPGASQMTLKLLFNDDGKVLGAQAVGYEGVDKRIDVIAAVIRLNGTVNDLAELELSYAPPYSSAKDPVNIAGYVAQNRLTGLSHLITWSELEQLNKNDYILVDVRTEAEYSKGHIEGAVNIPVDELRERLDELDKSKTIVVYCRVGYRGYIADRILSQNGFKVLNITGGYSSEPSG
ncbi:NADH oxidase Nox [Thermoclostridium stercorarium subsp. stercorarium DSM 8532]|uniref:NADH oxidase Nox n=2 Tax=Thermoclostridium stercorarium TaxID=1510 RepID=L7VT02_THES1|nr:FAD-dependent oxidoreductase [Thermoclostridium stercorarium]AGC68643.1 NADH oxidase Nox [Thermoclostridium stercorarium subsp. stercorarium DSM 8532]AGI39654.1 dehydrogenase [Thermoclostridium stercorarium subsp. stercorarium DSM 8532]ANW98985.1 CoA-disulfide reductase [Thermoclostridium stercorarium subsp. thermolacticum DSM 2910]UZQ84626.1 FAD-dependent oxidoreductase [Thermoclostridium stercorarium]